MENDEFLPPALSSFMRWFVLPSEVHTYIKNGEKLPKNWNYKVVAVYPRTNFVTGRHLTRQKSGFNKQENCSCVKHLATN